MKSATLLTALAMVATAMLAGCDKPPAPPTNPGGGDIQAVSVDSQDPAEFQTITAVETARVQYRHRLVVLQQYYEATGNMDKLNWATRELKNLDNAQTFSWQGLPEIQPPPAESIRNADERMLVEYAVGARRAYKRAVEQLAQLYEVRNEPVMAKLIRNMQARLDPIRTYMYFMDAEIPPADLKPERVDPQAEQLYAEAYQLHKDGKGLTFVQTDYAKQRQALMKFLELVAKHQDSTRIAQAAYFIGEIYKEYFNENLRAVHWYQRAWQWDPNISLPARFQAATVWDLRLKHHDRALELYRAAIEHEAEHTSNRWYARARIADLTDPD